MQVRKASKKNDSKVWALHRWEDERLEMILQAWLKRGSIDVACCGSVPQLKMVTGKAWLMMAEKQVCWTTSDNDETEKRC